VKVGVIGLGKMGVPMARRLLDAGHEVFVHNRSPKVLVEIGLAAAQLSDSAADLTSSCEFVLTALPTEDSVREVYGEVSAVAMPGQVFVDHSTVSPGLNQWCAKVLAERNAMFLDAPVSGGPAGAAAGSLTVMVGGDPEAFDQVLPVFEAFGKNIRRCGPVGARPGGEVGEPATGGDSHCCDRRGNGIGHQAGG
jgi:3-hydroxyisobutyrate dehydrogenase/2-hydroxy-3-oxopropionate reductase